MSTNEGWLIVWYAGEDRADFEMRVGQVAGRCRKPVRGQGSRVFVAACLLVCSVTLQAAQTCDTERYPASSPTARFEDGGDGTVTDSRSKLMWMRCSAGQTWAAGGCSGAASAITFASAQAIAEEVNQSGSFFFKDWRVPQLPELAGIVERQCEDPRVNLAIFPGTPAAFYWTASSRQGQGAGAFAFALSFGADGVRYISKEEANHVRLVRTAR